MVDINLFKEDDADEEKKDSGQEGSLDEGLGDLLGEDFADDLNSSSTDENQPIGLESESSDFDDDLLGADTDLDDVMPEFDETPDEKELGDYTGGRKAVTKGGPSVFLWILLGIVVVAAGFYFFIMVPKQKAIAKKQVKVTSKRPDVQKLIEEMRKKKLAAQGVKTDTSKKAAAQPAPIKTSTVQKRVNTPVQQTLKRQDDLYGKYALMSDKLITKLSSEQQFGALLIFEEGFAVEYSSAVPGKAKKLAEELKTLVNIKDIKISPEESHKSGGKYRYWGVISGKFPSPVSKSTISMEGSFTAKDISNKIKNLGSTNHLNVKKLQFFNVSNYSNRKKTQIRVKVEGSDNNIIAFLKQICSTKGNFRVLKVMVAPTSLLDVAGKNLKMVLDIEVIEGSAS